MRSQHLRSSLLVHELLRVSSQESVCHHLLFAGFLRSAPRAVYTDAFMFLTSSKGILSQACPYPSPRKPAPAIAVTQSGAMPPRIFLQLSATAAGPDRRRFRVQAARDGATQVPQPRQARRDPSRERRDAADRTRPRACGWARLPAPRRAARAKSAPRGNGQPSPRSDGRAAIATVPRALAGAPRPPMRL